MIPLTFLPTLNAILNALSAVLLVTGYAMIRQRRIAAHRFCMVSAVVTSSLFLISYLTYHVQIGSKHFSGQGWIRAAYFSILISHTTLAITIVPLVLVTLRNALRGNFERHAGIARRTLPLWLYVSVTGVVVYWMLYRLPS